MAVAETAFRRVHRVHPAVVALVTAEHDHVTLPVVGREHQVVRFERGGQRVKTCHCHLRVQRISDHGQVFAGVQVEQRAHQQLQALVLLGRVVRHIRRAHVGHVANVHAWPVKLRPVIRRAGIGIGRGAPCGGEFRHRAFPATDQWLAAKFRAPDHRHRLPGTELDVRRRIDGHAIAFSPVTHRVAP